MTAEEIIVAAMARCTDLGPTVPMARSVYLRRIGLRQAQIFSRVASTHPDYFGTSATVSLVANEYDLTQLNPKAERVTDVRIANPGTSGLAADDVVNIILLSDRQAMLPPRAVIRDQKLKALDLDLQGVTSVTIYYSRRPAESSTIAAGTQLELPEQFQDLLVVDLARQMIRKLLDVEPNRRDGWVEILNGEEKELLATLDQHVRNFAHAEQNRFRPPSAPPAGSDRG